jgi:hypothetical protein
MNAILKCDDLDFSYESWAQVFEDSAKTPVYAVHNNGSEEQYTFYSFRAPYCFTFASRLREIIQESNPQVLSFMKEELFFRTIMGDNPNPKHFGDIRGLILSNGKKYDSDKLLNFGIDEKRLTELSKEKRRIHLKFMERLFSENVERETRIKDVIPSEYFRSPIFVLDWLILMEADIYYNNFAFMERYFKPSLIL